MNITFLNEMNYDEFPPIATKDLLPDWYKNSKSYLNDIKATQVINDTLMTTATIKKCMPVFDVLTSGYFIQTWADIKISNKNEVVFYEIDSNVLSEHNKEQAQGHPFVRKKDDLIAKFINNWGIKTPKGYSCLFMPPAHRKNIISIMPAIVDTDTYNLAVHFPFTLSDPTFEGVIPKGTPIVQVIPFKRDEWKMNIESMNTDDKIKQYELLNKNTINRYRTSFWSKKEYNK